ncbi:MAG: 60 kDa inner rane insertion protein preprotein translocase subunit YidC [Candidatus Adlerbacteria bacterium]|nr:60 kDa inner rane insertion protein preprotein translocase subunit YidC [Candidatus Adlerbacteria bacterium]
MFETFLVKPLYNIFIFLIGIMPFGDVGFAIIALTLIIRVIFYPAFSASIRTQMGMQEVQGDLDHINKTYKDQPDERAKRTMELFKEKNIRPFAGFLALFVQIPIFLALYFAFFREGLPSIATDLLYSFVHAPQAVNLMFLGLVNLQSAHNIPIAIIVALTQYGAIRLSVMRTAPGIARMAPEKQSAQRIQQYMMLYGMPILLGSIAYSFPAAVGIYFTTGNLVSMGQEWIIKRQLEKSAA